MSDMKKWALGKLKLSEAIRLGSKMMPELRFGFLNSIGCCAIGAAWLGLGHTHAERMRIHTSEAFEIISKETGADIEIIREASNKHHDSKLSREAIADWIEREFESEIPQESTSSTHARLTQESLGVEALCWKKEAVCTS